MNKREMAERIDAMTDVLDDWEMVVERKEGCGDFEPPTPREIFTMRLGLMAGLEEARWMLLGGPVADDPAAHMTMLLRECLGIWHDRVEEGSWR